MLQQHKSLSQKAALVFICLLSLSLVCGGLTSSKTVQAASSTGWQSSGVVFPVSPPASYLTNPFYAQYSSCYDATQPNVLIYSSDVTSTGVGTFSFNWKTGQKTQLSTTPFDECSSYNGLRFYNTSPGENTGKFYRATSTNATPQQIAHYPTRIATDGSLQAYSTVSGFSFHNGIGKGEFWASSDGGLNWQQHNGAIGPVASVAISQPSGQDIYALTYTFDETSGNLNYTIYFSVDAGANWQKRFSGSGKNSGFGTIGLVTLPSPNTPVDTVLLAIDNGIPGDNEAVNYYLSSDGARSFNLAGTVGPDYASVQLYQTTQGIVRLTSTLQQYQLSVSKDGGKNWLPLTLPFAPQGVLATILLQSEAPDTLFFSTPYNNSPSDPQKELWRSDDAGLTWQQLAVPPTDASLTYTATPYLPTTLLAHDSKGNLFSYDFPDVGKTQTLGVAADGATGGQYYAATGHNLSPLFNNYWQSNGGLAIFGYPKTEPFREVNAADGKIYTVQYFERNRFEYHPKFINTPYIVELGLLGNQLTASRKAAKEGAFNYFADAHYPGGIYFPQTGHNLRNSFKDYWQAHGGLAIFGYPISEEFNEVNPDDGQTYVVQYFERNRFEYHPDNPPAYQVELGLLGNTLLQQKGWLPK